jgi:hypothetical protein
MKMQAAAQTEAQRQQYDAAMAQQKLQSEEQFNRWKTELEAATKIMVEELRLILVWTFPQLRRSRQHLRR